MKKLSTQIILTIFLIGLSSVAVNAATLISVKAKSKVKPAFVQSQSIPKFSGINVGGPFNVTVRIGQKEEVRMEGDKDVISRIETKVENSVLKIGFKDRKRGWNWSSEGGERVKIFVTVRNLKSLAVSGSGKAVVEGTLRGDSFSSVVSGSGNLTIDAEVKSFSGVISGSGAISASGSSGASEITISGSGSFRGKDFKTGSAEVRVSGSGSATIFAENHLEAVLSGSGNIRYSGNPHVDVTKSGSGSVSKL